MAGVPPFLGFFTKLFIFVIILNASFFLIYWIFFLLLFLGLYFYVQNIRFLNTSYSAKLVPSFYNLIKIQRLYPLAAISGTVFLLFGVYHLDEIFLLFY